MIRYAVYQTSNGKLLNIGFANSQAAIDGRIAHMGAGYAATTGILDTMDETYYYGGALLGWVLRPTV